MLSTRRLPIWVTGRLNGSLMLLRASHLMKFLCRRSLGPANCGAASAPSNGRQEVIAPWLEEIRDPGWAGTPVEKAEQAYAELRQRPPAERWHGLQDGESVRSFVDQFILVWRCFLPNEVSVEAMMNFRCGRWIPRVSAFFSSLMRGRTRCQSGTCWALCPPHGI